MAGKDLLPDIRNDRKAFRLDTNRQVDLSFRQEKADVDQQAAYNASCTKEQRRHGQLVEDQTIDQ